MCISRIIELTHKSWAWSQIKWKICVVTICNLQLRVFTQIKEILLILYRRRRTEVMYKPVSYNCINGVCDIDIHVSDNSVKSFIFTPWKLCFQRESFQYVISFTYLRSCRSNVFKNVHQVQNLDSFNTMGRFNTIIVMVITKILATSPTTSQYPNEVNSWIQQS